MPLKVFFSSVTSSVEMTKRQTRIFNVLQSMNIPHEVVDISQDSKDKDLMRAIAGNSTALPPQICNGDVYCGDFIAFENAVEMEELEQFLKL